MRSDAIGIESAPLKGGAQAVRQYDLENIALNGLNASHFPPLRRTAPDQIAA